MLDEQTLVLGLTGPFGSGCSTAAEFLVGERGYRSVKLSQILRERLTRALGTTPTREQLQTAGDGLREAAGRGVLVDEDLARLEADPEPLSLVVLDGLRNLGEITALKDRFGYRFSLLGVVADAESRWDRVKGEYRSRGLARSAFVDDDDRDKGGRGANGQQVSRCVDEADGVVVNDEEVKRKELRDTPARACGRALRRREAARELRRDRHAPSL